MEEESAVNQQNSVTEMTKQNDTEKDNGIFDFVTPDRAIELYKEIISNRIPKLDWQFYGRRKPGEPTEEDHSAENVDESKEANSTKEIEGSDNNLADDFDFDEEFGHLAAPLGSTLQLKKRPGQDSDRKTNLSDIMSDIMKQSHSETIIESSLMQDTKDCTINEDSNAMLVDQIDEDRTELDDIQQVYAIEQEIKNEQRIPIGNQEEQSVNEVVNEIQSELMRELEDIPLLPQETRPED